MKKFLSIILFSVLMWGAFAQKTDDPVIFEINGKNIYKSQFMKDFLQSIGKDPAAAPTACTYEKRKALEDYVQLYVNFQAKLTDAYAQGLDTIHSLNEELATYRKELAAPYLIDSATMQSLLHEAYDRSQYALHAAHILVPCQENALPADTLKAYNHAMELYEAALKNANFYAVAGQEMRDQRLNDRDPLVRQRAEEINEYEGELGCFTVFDMIYPFESAAYAMTPGQISKPVRSRYGYHIIKLFERNKYYGKSQVAHIWISEKDPNAKGKINSAYSKLQAGEAFGTVAKNYSDDRTTASKGGVMPVLACNQMPSEYVAAIAEGLKVGEFSKPIHSRYGWHIIQLVSQETVPSFESMVPYLKSRMTRGERSTKPQHMFVDQCKQRYDFVDYTTTKVSKKKNAPYAADLSAVRAVISDSIFSGIFHYDSAQITDMRPLFKIGDRQYDSRQLANYIYKTKKVYRLCDLDIFLRERYEEFVDATVLEYADSRLEQDNAEFAALIDEYRQGLMIFAYNDHNVWSRAVKDTVGFAEFYARESQKHVLGDSADAVYFWNQRARVKVYTFADSMLLSPAKAVKLVNKAIKKGWDDQKLAKSFISKKNASDFAWIEDLQLVERGNQSLLGPNEWQTGVYAHIGMDAKSAAQLKVDIDSATRGYQVLVVEKLLEPELKSREEARGYYLNDYQNYLEEQNNAVLRNKYKIKIHQDVIDEIVY